MTIRIVDEKADTSFFQDASCAFGVFDGLHLGHRYIINKAFDSREPDCNVIILTFDIDPDEVFHPQRLKKLMRNDDRLRALDELGADYVACLPFVPSLYSKSPEQFLADLFGKATPATMHVGEDFKFGARAAGTVKTLRQWGAESGCAICAHELVVSDGAPITSTRIRKALERCDVEEAKTLLGRPYRLCETVHKGRGEGSSFGFATANLLVKPQDSVLGDGVYAAHAVIDGVQYKAAVSVGVSPTFESTTTANVEAHVLDFEGDLVGKEIALDFEAFLRPMMKFDSTEELVATVMSNIEWVRENL